MKSISVGVLAIITGGCMTVSEHSGQQENWCTSHLVPNAQLGESVNDVEVIYVLPAASRRAGNLLRHRTFIPITAEEVRSLTGMNSDPNGRYYLVRSGSLATPEGNVSQAFLNIREVSRRLFFFDSSNGILTVANFQMWADEPTMFNVPLVLKTSLDVRGVRSFCEWAS
jgi:hypothetical protein